MPRIEDIRCVYVLDAWDLLHCQCIECDDYIPWRHRRGLIGVLYATCCGYVYDGAHLPGTRRYQVAAYEADCDNVIPFSY